MKDFCLSGFNNLNWAQKHLKTSLKVLYKLYPQLSFKNKVQFKVVKYIFDLTSFHSF